MKALLHSALAAGLCAAVLTGTPVDTGPVQTTAEVRLAAATQGATVLTLEGGLVGLQPFLHFTPLQLQGDLCKQPNTCKPVDYFAMPLGAYFNRQGAKTLTSAVAKLPADAPVIPFGHSQGGQVIYAAVRDWVANPTAETTPDPSRLSWVSIGNPENAFGGTKKQDGLPPDTPYHGIEVIKQYDGWADSPDGPFNLLAWLNAQVGKSTTHVFGYFDVDLESPDNIRYTPEITPGVPGNITYVFVPNDTLPLVEMTGILAPLLNPILDPILRPIIESGYNRPIGPVPSNSQQPSVAAVRSAATRRAAQPTASVAEASVSAVPAPALRQRSAAERQPATAVRGKPAAAGRPAASERNRTAERPMRAAHSGG